jgi:DNA polymerase V
MFALVDCNSFCCSCERVFNPTIRRRPVIVLSNNDGCAIALTPEAKALGIKMGDPFFQIKDTVEKHGIAVFSSNYTLYGDMSQRVMETLQQFSPDIEIYSIDEAFLSLDGFRDLHAHAAAIRHTVRQWTGIPVGVGVAPTKTLAKIANHSAKKHPQFKERGICVLPDRAAWEPVLAQHDVADVWGIGRQYAAKLRAAGVDTALKFSQLPDSWVRREMTVVGLRTAQELRGDPCLALELTADPKKGITVSRSFGQRLTRLEDVVEATASYAARAGEKLRAEGLMARHMQVFMHTSPHATDRVKDPYHAPSLAFEMPYHTDYSPALIHYASWAMRRMFRPGHRYMKSGVILTDIVPAGRQNLDLFDTRDTAKEASLMKALDQLNGRMGGRTVFYAGTGVRRAWSTTFQRKSLPFTTDWNSLLLIHI